MAPTRRLAACGIVCALVLTGCSVYGPPYCPQPASPPTPPPPAASAKGPLYERALAYDSFYQETLRPEPHGGLVNVAFSSGTTSDPQGYDDQQDSTIWTGLYLAAEAFRYASTGDPAERQEALANARGAVDTLHLFLKVTGVPGLLARFAGPLDSTQSYLSGYCDCSCAAGTAIDPAGVCCPNNKCFGSKTRPELFWLGDTSRDQYSGWFFGMGIAYRLIDDPDLRQTIRSDVQEVITVLRQSKWKIPESGGTAADAEPLEQLSWLLTAADVLQDSQSCDAYRDEVRKVWPILEDSVGSDVEWMNRYMQYYGFNLDFVNNYNLIRLEPDPRRRKAYLGFLMHIYRSVKGTDNVFFDYVTLASGGRAPSGTAASDLTALGQFPATQTPAACVVPPKAELSKLSIDLYRLNEKAYPKRLLFHPQAEHAYPVAQRCRQDFLWQQTPYAICCCPVTEGQTWIPSEYQSVCNSLTPPASGEDLYYPGVDYLIAYWMGRYHGFLKATD